MGMTDAPHILFGDVMHARLFPKKNAFRYGIYYIAIPLSNKTDLPIARNRFAPLSFYDRDHGECDESSLEKWARTILARYGLDKVDGDITLVCMPRVIGYVFTPVSFWICRDKDSTVRAVICEVNNTFGERHSYLCAHPDQRPLTGMDILKGEKLFHVSPFLERAGHYTFRFDFSNDKFGAWIDFYNEEGHKKLVTSLIGTFQPMSKKTLRHAFWTYPLVTFKAILLIHWQALKIVTKSIGYIPKPAQNHDRLSATENLTKL